MHLSLRLFRLVMGKEGSSQGGVNVLPRPKIKTFDRREEEKDNVKDNFYEHKDSERSTGDISFLEFLELGKKPSEKKDLGNALFSCLSICPRKLREDFPVMLPCRWCTEVTQAVRTRFRGLEFHHNGLLLRAFIHPSYCDLKSSFTARGLVPTGSDILRLVYTSWIVHVCPSALWRRNVTISEIVDKLMSSRILTETCTTLWGQISDFVLTNEGIYRLPMAFTSSTGKLKREKLVRNFRLPSSRLHESHLDWDAPDTFGKTFSDPMMTTAENVHKAKTNDDLTSLEETFVLAFMGALYYDRGIRTVIEFVSSYMQKFALSLALDDDTDTRYS